MVTQTEPTVIRHGRVILGEANSTPPTRQSFLVREWSDGSMEYLLGTPLARTSDGWVSLAEHLRSKVTWDS